MHIRHHLADPDEWALAATANLGQSEYRFTGPDGDFYSAPVVATIPYRHLQTGGQVDLMFVDAPRAPAPEFNDSYIEFKVRSRTYMLRLSKYAPQAESRVGDCILIVLGEDGSAEAVQRMIESLEWHYEG